MIAPGALTLGLLAGGQGTRLDGANKALLMRNGVPQVQRIARRFDGDVAHVLVSANRDLDRLAALGFDVVRDRVPGLGPIGGLDALAEACTTPWLLTCPVDVVSVNDCLAATLASAGGQGACVEDDEGVQPLVALWDVAALRVALSARAADDASVKGLQAALHMPAIRLKGVRFGNLNTPEDLAAAGVRMG